MEDDKRKDLTPESPGLDIIPEDGQLEEIIKDKRIFGVYKDEAEADRAIRQLNKLGYSAEDIYLFTQDPAKTEKITEGFSEDFHLMSCSDGSDFVGASYDSGDVVICVLKDADLFGQRSAANAPAKDRPKTAMDVQEEMSREKQKKAD